MRINFYIDDNRFIAGTTMRDERDPEEGNMALHTCRNRSDVLENRKTLARTLECSPDDFVCANQTHGSNFQRVGSAEKGRGAFEAESSIADTDALYTFEPGLLLCCFTADCVPLIFYEEDSGATGVIHSGWAGTVQEITLKVFRHLIEREDCDPKSFHVMIGPAVSQKNFEVDEDVYAKFHSLGYAEEFIYYNEKTRKYHIDNQLTVKRQCEIAGIPPEHVTIDRTCTLDSPQGFSYRRDKSTGRHMSFIIKKY
mgnify:CR=1 FL=1